MTALTCGCCWVSRRGVIVICWVVGRVLLGLVGLCWILCRVVDVGHLGDGRPVAAPAGVGRRGGLAYRGGLPHRGPGRVGAQRERRGLAASTTSRQAARYASRWLT
jgi:hypothetical protein